MKSVFLTCSTSSRSQGGLHSGTPPTERGAEKETGFMCFLNEFPFLFARLIPKPALVALHCTPHTVLTYRVALTRGARPAGDAHSLRMTAAPARQECTVGKGGGACAGTVGQTQFNADRLLWLCPDSILHRVCVHKRVWRLKIPNYTDIQQRTCTHTAKQEKGGDRPAVGEIIS